MSQSTECARAGLTPISAISTVAVALGLCLARLAVLPGTTHVTLIERAAWLTPMVTEFLDAPMPQAE